MINIEDMVKKEYGKKKRYGFKIIEKKSTLGTKIDRNWRLLVVIKTIAGCVFPLVVESQICSRLDGLLPGPNLHSSNLKITHLFVNNISRTG